MTEAVDALRRSFILSLLVLGVFFSSLQVAREQLRLYDESRDLIAWLLLRERIKEIKQVYAEKQQNDDGFFQEIGPDVKVGEMLVSQSGPVRDPSDVTWRTETLRVSTEWPRETSVAIALEPIKLDFIRGDEMRLYRIRAKSVELPLQDYIVAFAKHQYQGAGKDDPSVIPASWLKQIRGYESLQLRFLDQNLRTMNRPRMWDRVSYKLSKYGFAQAPTALKSTDLSVHGLLAESDPRRPEAGVQILGMRLGMGVFFSVVGIIMGVVAFTMIGPVLSLRSADAVVRSGSWILLVPSAPGLARTALEWSIVLVTMVWTLLPLVVLGLQLQMLSDLALVTGRWAVLTGFAGLAFSTVVHGVVSGELRTLRRRVGNEVLDR